MRRILLLIPSRGRPKQAQEAYASAYAQSGLRAGLDVSIVIDADDPELAEYEQGNFSIIIQPSFGSMGEALDYAAVRCAAHGQWDIIGFMGDDHRVRAPGWDNYVRMATSGGERIVYGPDGSNNLQRELPTFVFISTSIIQKLGYMVPPGFKHFYIDDAWREIGKATDTLVYVPELYVEHLHFSFGKSERDATYDHTMAVGSQDGGVYANWIASGGPVEASIAITGKAQWGEDE